MTQAGSRKLGRKPARLDSRTLKLAAYAEGLPSAPPACDLTARLSNLGQMGNDQLGDCTCAAVGHMIQAWTVEDETQIIVPDADIVKMYSEVSGYIPGDESTDNGAVVLDVLNYWRKTGLDGHRLGAYAELRLRNQQEVMKSIYYFGAAYVGLSLPLSAQKQAIWNVPEEGASGAGQAGSWGGHAIPFVAYNATGPICITWGQLQQMTWDFYDAYGEEAYACFGRDIVGSDDKSPEGFNTAQLLTDLRKITA